MLQTWEMIVFVCYGIPCVSLYVFVLYQIIFKPGYRSAFFKLSIVIGIIVGPFLMGRNCCKSSITKKFKF